MSFNYRPKSVRKPRGWFAGEDEKPRTKWKNLMENKCPKCDTDWAFGLTVVDGLFAHECGFQIREIKYREIVASMQEKKLADAHETDTQE